MQAGVSAAAAAAATTPAAAAAGLLKVQLQQSKRNVYASDGSVIIKQLGKGLSVSTQLVAQAPQAPAGLLLDCKHEGAAAADVVVNLGEVCGRRFLGCCRIKLCWMAPYHASSIAALPGHMQFLLVELDQAGAYAVILPLLPDDCKATMQPVSGQEPGGNLLQLRLDSGNLTIQRSSWQAAVYIAAGSDPYTLLDSAVTTAAAIAGGAKPRWQKQLPDISALLGWCTWDAFYTDVSGRGIAAGLQSFQDAGVQPRWIIIDDGWQRTGLSAPAAAAAAAASATGDSTQQQGDEQQSHSSAAAAAASAHSSSRSSWRSSLWWMSRKIKKALGRVEKLLLLGVSAVVDRLNWWSILLAGLRSPLSGVLVRLLKGYNIATSEHSKRLLSNEFNAKFKNSTIGPVPATNSAASATDVAAVISKLKQQYGLQHILAWHAILGYWSGVSPAAVAALPAAAAVATAAAAALSIGAAVIEASDTPALEPNSSAGVTAAAPAGMDRAAADVSSSTGHTAATAAVDAPPAGGRSGIKFEAMKAAVVLPRVTPAMSDLEPPCNWSQLVLAGLGLPPEPARFLQQLHSYLAALGIDGVKVDVQNQLELAGAAPGQPGGQALARQWHQALETSGAQHFPGNTIINCMCHNTNNLYRMSVSALARVSDDFYPRLPASHTTHVAVCAYNSLFMGPLVLPDWDMFHSHHPRAVLHATARMISGGPVYVSDAPGRHDPALLARLALPDGRLLQPLLPGRPTLDCLFTDPCKDGVSLLKLFSRNACGGVVAVFHLQGSGWSRSHLKYVTHDPSPPALSAHVSPADVHHLQHCLTGHFFDSSSSSSSHDDGVNAATTAAGAAAAVNGEMRAGDQGTVTPELQHTGGYVLYCDSTGVMTVVPGAAEGLTLEIQPSGSDVVTVAPLLQLQCADQPHSSCSGGGGGGSNGGSVALAVVGLTNMLNPGGAVRSVTTLTTAEANNSSGGGSGGKSSADAISGSSTPSSRSSSGSWVLTKGEEVAMAAAAVDAQQAVAVVQVKLLGCGQLLLYCSCKPAAVVLDGCPAEFTMSCSRLMVEVPAPAACNAGDGHSSLEHKLELWF